MLICLSEWKAVSSFATTVQKQLNHVEMLLRKIDAHEETIDEISIEDVDTDNPTFESLLVGRKVKVLLQDMDKIRWRQDLIEDRNRLATFISAAEAVTVEHYSKLAELRSLIKQKTLNPGFLYFYENHLLPYRFLTFVR